MKSWNNKNQDQHQESTSIKTRTPLSKRRLKTIPALIVMGILFVGNLFWFVLWIIALNSNENGGDEIVATVDGDSITRQEWMVTMETLYGKDTLHSLVNDAVMEKAAKKYNIMVTDAEIDLEIALMSSNEHTDSYLKILEEQQIRQKVRSQLILEKVITKDILIEDSVIANVYEENKHLYNTPTTYRTSLITVNSIDEAKNVLNELKNGSEFSVLARERSIDTLSASLGGNIGYITVSQTNIDPEIKNAVQYLNKNEYSDPISLSNGKYGLVYVTEVNEGKSFTYEDVKEHIRTELAMEQLPINASTEMFWKEFNATSYFMK